MSRRIFYCERGHRDPEHVDDTGLNPGHRCSICGTPHCKLYTSLEALVADILPLAPATTYPIYVGTVGPKGGMSDESQPGRLCLAATDDADARRIAEGYGEPEGSFIIEIQRLFDLTCNRRGLLHSVPWRREP